MGIVRTLLALSVMLTHASFEGLVGGQLAVQLFYMISGFLMSVVLTSTSAYDNPVRFWLNRALRLYPTYFFIFLLSIAVLVAAQATGQNSKLGDFAMLSAGSQIVLVAANLLLFGQDAVCFLQELPSVGVAFTSDFAKAAQPLIRFLVVPQAWSLSVELLFYLLIPFIVRRPAALFVLLCASLGLRGAALAHGFGGNDPWSYRFFPFELAIFLFGALSHRYLMPVLQSAPGVASAASPATLVLFIALLVVYPAIPLADWMKQVAMMLVFALCMPLLFEFSSRSRWDRNIGDLSYPIYLSHLIVLIPVTRLLQGHKHVALAVSIVLTVGLALFINRTIEARVERYRERIRNGVASSNPNSSKAAPRGVAAAATVSESQSA